jgi:pimeloyl-ACP methyl ester carboxylesterase
LQKLLILFVHGLAGSDGSWGKFDELIATDPQLSKKVETAHFTYPTKLVRWWPFGWKSMRTQQIADSLMTEIDRRFVHFERILLVCHSMGGLVGKRYIIANLERGLPLRVQGIIFFATPHTGAGLATAANLLSTQHYHVRQLRKDSDFLDLVTRSWVDLKCDSKLRTFYVTAGQDQVVHAKSSEGPPGSHHDTIANAGHISVIKPESAHDLSFLIVKQTAVRLLSDGNQDIAAANSALGQGDKHSLLPLIVNKGRSWIETEDADQAVELLQSIASRFDSADEVVVWSRYLLAIARLFKYRDASSTAFDDKLIQRAEAIGAGLLFRAEKMEFARQRGDRVAAARIANELIERLQTVAPPTSTGEAYSTGTAYFLLGNLFRYGGAYCEAREVINRAREVYRPTILAHQIELVHCRYALAVCRAMEGRSSSDEVQVISPAAEFRPFAEALLTLTQSHSEWTLGRTGEASEHAEKASQAFEQIRFYEYAKRAKSLVGLLGAWQRLSLGASADQAIVVAPNHAPILRGVLGQPSAYGNLIDKIRTTRPSQVLGLLQFASAYNPDWTVDIGDIELPPILRRGEAGSIEWTGASARSLAEADGTLRRLMGIRSDVLVPLIAD